jgi:hypothetical protein
MWFHDRSRGVLVYLDGFAAVMSFPLRANLMQIRDIGCGFDSFVTVTSRATSVYLSLRELERELMVRDGEGDE